MMGEPMLQVEELEAGYGEVQVLWGITLAADPGKLTFRCARSMKAATSAVVPPSCSIEAAALCTSSVMVFAHCIRASSAGELRVRQ